MKRKLTVGLMAAALAVVPAATAMADGHLGTLQVLTQTIDVPAAEDDAQIVIVHGVPDLEVDILVDGAAALEGVNFTDIAVTELPAGTYDLGVAPAGTTDAVLSAEGVEVTAGVSYSVVAHLDADGSPTLLLEANVTDEGAGIQVFHTAAFGAVDIQPTDATGLEGVTNGQTAFIATGEGTVPGVGIAAAGEDDAALSLGDVDVPADTSILAYAVGALADGDDDTGTDNGDDTTDEDADDDADDDADEDADEEEVAVPTHVDAGTAGLADSGLPLWVTGLMVLGALALLAPVAATVRRRS